MNSEAPSSSGLVVEWARVSDELEWRFPAFNGYVEEYRELPTF